MTTPTVGRLAIVLHTHMPWVLGYGTWPVGEEWLRQAWAHAYLPMFALLRERAERGLTDQLTLGVTPVLAAQWDDRTSVHEQARWIADWHTRASGKALEASRTADESAARDAQRNYQLAITAAHELDEHWSACGSADLRPLVDSGVIELLGGPLTHAFTPHLSDPLIDLSLQAGLADTTVRVGHRPTGMWAPECAYRPGLEQFYARHRVSHFMVDGPTLQRAGASLHQPHRIGDTDVVAFGRDLELTYRVWSPDRGYPGDPWYLDFHSFDHAWGMRSYRVTDKQSDAKDAYEPHATAASIDRDVHDFISAARTIMLNSPTPDPVIVAAYDTELFGHWWHEGPAFLARLLDKVPEAGIELTTLSRERSGAADSPPIELPSGSWGSGKDFGVWEEGEAGELHIRGRTIQNAVCDYLASHRRSHRTGRDHFGDALATETFLALASDWAFMITKDSAADYARNRADGHFQRVVELLHSAGHEPGQSRITTRDTRLPFLDSRTWRPASHGIGVP